jgi:outer membrane protein assembly factor BamB
VTFHAAAKPLPAGAVVAESASFLGPNHNLVVPETKLLDVWPDAGPRAVWEMTKGSGYAAPAVLGDRLVLFHRVEGNDVVDCLHPATGQRYWRFTYPSTYRDRYGYSDGPRATPVIGHDSVYTLGCEGKLHCLELTTGRVRWARDIKTEFKLRPGFFGLGSTPLIEADKLIVNVGAVPDGPCVVAFDCKTGKAVWGAGKDWGMSYASPVPAVIHGKRRVMVFAGGETNIGEPVTGGLLSIDPDNGKVDFAFPWRGDRRESVNASNPLVIGNRVFISECYGAGGAMVEILPDFKPKLIWENKAFGTHFMVALHKDGDAPGGYLYGIDGHGPADAFLACVDAATGKEQWKMQPEWKEQVGQRLLIAGTYRAHLLQADGKTWMLGEFGHLLRVELTPKEFRDKQRATLFTATETWTPPVLSRGLMYICQNNPDRRNETKPRVICYDFREE